MLLGRTMLRWLPIATAFSILAACAETVPVEIVLVGLEKGAIDGDNAPIRLCLDGEEILTAGSIESGMRIEIGDRSGILEVNAKHRVSGWAWGSAFLAAARPVRVALSQVWQSADVSSAELDGLVAPRVASAGDGRVVVVGQKPGEPVRAWIWDVFSGSAPTDYFDLEEADGAGYSVTSLDRDRVLVAWSADRPRLAVLDVDAGVLLDLDASCEGVLDQGWHGAGSFFEQGGSTSRVLLAGGGSEVGAGSRKAVFFDAATGQCRSYELGQARFAPAIAAQAGNHVIVFGGEDVAADRDHENVLCEDECEIPSPQEDVEDGDGDGSPPNPEQRTGHTATWVRVEDTTWVLGGTTPTTRGATCPQFAIGYLAASDRPSLLEQEDFDFRRAGHAAVELADLLSARRDTPSGRLLVAGGTECAGTDAFDEADVIAFDPEGAPGIERVWGGQAIDLTSGADPTGLFSEASAAEVTANAILVLGDGGAARLVNPGPHPASDSPCATDPNSEASEGE